jgi:hypothetical protein
MTRAFSTSGFVPGSIKIDFFLAATRRSRRFIKPFQKDVTYECIKQLILHLIEYRRDRKNKTIVESHINILSCTKRPFFAKPPIGGPLLKVAS